MKTNNIIVNKRSRKDPGDIEGLANSIKDIGLLHPIVITANNELIAGERRLLAFQSLNAKNPNDGWDDIPTTVADSFDSVRALLIAERDENTCRKDFTPSEAVELGKKLEGIISTPVGRPKKNGGKLPPLPKGKTRDKVGTAVGMSGKTYEKAKEIVEAAEEDPETYADLVDVMDGKSVNAATKEKKKRDREKVLEKLAKEAERIPQDERYTLYLGDAIEQGANIPDNSIDLILTDPPYPKDDIECWSKLSKLAERVLKPSGYVIAYSGQFHLHDVMTRLSEHLIYYWTFALLHSGGNQLVSGRNALCGWKPLLVFQKEPAKRKEIVFTDVIEGSGREKTEHKWQQGLEELDKVIESFTKPGDVILDPFMGSGTTIIASIKNDRTAYGIEVDEKEYTNAKGRISEYLQINAK